jgi:hypothetical protein
MTNGSFGKTYSHNNIPFDPGRRVRPKANLDQLDLAGCYDEPTITQDQIDDLIDVDFYDDPEDRW